MLKKTVLIIDDHQNFREMVKSFINNNFNDIDIKEASTGEGGVVVARDLNPAVSLIDVRLPGIDGIETARQIKEYAPECQIIAMSMFKQNSLQELLQQKGIVFINKDDIDSGLIPLLNKFLDGHKT